VPATVGGWDGGVGVVSSHTWQSLVATTAALPLTSTGRTLSLAIAGTGTWAISGWRGCTSTSPLPSRSSWGFSPGRNRLETIATSPGDWVHRYFDVPSTPDTTQGSSGGDVSLGIALVVPVWSIEEVIGKVGATFTLPLR
jgi:hypothetical protein